MKKSIINILLFCLLQSCSNDNITNNKLIGKWVLIESYDSGVLVDSECSQYLYIEFKTNNELVANYINYNATPETCKEFDFEINYWKKSNGKIKTYRYPNELYAEILFEGENLVMESTEYAKKFVYTRLNSIK